MYIHIQKTEIDIKKKLLNIKIKMGIKYFFTWFKDHFAKDMLKLRRGQKFNDIHVSVDNLMIDMNGVFHNSTQKIYEYGNCKPPPRMLHSRQPRRQGGFQLQLKVFEDVCRTIEQIFSLVEPLKRLILCVDGPAPQSKQNQQRQRRFRAAAEKDDNEFASFDSNCLTPGTKFMDYLTKYIDWYIRKRISEDSRWQNIEIILSNEKASGEGEHKIINYIRYYGVPTDSYCIHGLDADLIMLAMGTHVPNFYILREDLYDRSNEFFCIRIGNVRGTLAELMRWECEGHVFDPETAINDFIFICFMVGNDFLPHVPSLEIIERGIEIMIDVYKQVGNTGGHMTENVSCNIRYIPDTLAMFLNIISGYEKSILEDKLSRKKSFFPDPLLENCSVQNKDRYELDIDKYRNDYCIASFPEDVSIEQICHEYLEGLQWVLSYYTRGVPNWKWQFPYHYAPPASVLVDHIRTFTFPNYGRTIPATPFQQLLSVLPPKSSQLIPHPLNLLLTSEDSPLRGICPDNFEVDLAGKRKEWEGIVLLPMVDFPVVNEAYLGKINEVDQRDNKRNVSGRSFVYVYTPNSNSVFKSYYGDIQECKVKTTMIDL